MIELELARISHEGGYIGVPNLRKCFCEKDLLRFGGIP